jgi:hypothetical protein
VYDTLLELIRRHSRIPLDAGCGTGKITLGLILSWTKSFATTQASGVRRFGFIFWKQAKKSCRSCRRNWLSIPPTSSRSGRVSIRINPPLEGITPGQVHLKDEILEASTVVLSAGIVSSPIVARLPVEKDRHGKIAVEATMRCKQHPEVWTAGDCGSIPDPTDKPYPHLAQHAMREAKVLADDIYATVSGLQFYGG